MLVTALLILANMSLAAKVTETPAKEVTQDIEIILDASGSMQAMIGKQTKIAIAKKVLIDLVESLKDRTDLALAVRAYGHQSHRDKKDCKDTKLEIPFGKPDPKKVKTLMKRIKAQGWTPIAYSLLEAKKDFDLKAKRKRSIILITDGLESCAGNPCKVATKLASPEVNIEIHVIGFDLKKAEMKKLECLVKPSGGLILGAKDAGQLTKALKKAIETSLGGTLKITAFRDKKRIGATVRAYKPGGKYMIKGGFSSKTKPLFLNLPPGTYDIKVIDIKVEGEPTLTLSGIKIEVGKTIEKSVDFSGGGLKISVIKNGKPAAGRVYVHKQDSRKAEFFKYISKDRPAECKLVPGVYDLIVEDTDATMAKIPTVSFKGVKVNPGEIVEKTAEFFGGVLNISLIKNGKPSYGRAYVFKQGSTKREASKGIGIKGPAEFKLVPGSYDIIVEDTQSDISYPTVTFKGVNVKAGGIVEKTAKFSEGFLQISVIKNGKPASGRAYVFKQGSTKRESWKNIDIKRPTEFKLVPGVYDVKTWDDKSNEKMFKGIKIKTGKTEIIKAKY